MPAKRGFGSLSQILNKRRPIGERARIGRRLCLPRIRSTQQIDERGLLPAIALPILDDVQDMDRSLFRRIRRFGVQLALHVGLHPARVNEQHLAAVFLQLVVQKS